MVALTLLDSQLIDIAEVVIAASIEVSNAVEDPDFELPNRIFVTTGGAVYDCEQVSVSGNGLTPGVPGSGQNNVAQGPCSGPWSTDIDIAIVRKSTHGPTGKQGRTPPTSEAYARDAKVSARDIEVLRRAAIVLSQPYPGGFGYGVSSIIAGAAQGGMMAAVLTITISYSPAPGA